MSTIPMDILEKVRKECQTIIDKLKTMPMSNIVNVIEQIKACQILIHPITTKDITVNSCLSTCDVLMFMGTQEQTKIVIDKTFHHHFIHYVQSDNKELERIRVSHECGHCYFAWPLKERQERYTAIVPEVKLELYLLKFELIDELYADAFASIMANYLFSSSEKYPDVVINKKLLNKIEEYASKGYLQSTFFRK